MLKLNYVSCIYYNVDNTITQGGVAGALGPGIVDLTILFYTSNASGSYILLPGGAKLYGYGYAISTHATNFPSAVYVSTSNTSLNPATQTFDLYVLTGPAVGCAMISAMTSTCQSYVTR